MNRTLRMLVAAVVAAGWLAMSGARGLEMALVPVAAPGGVANTGDTPHGGYGSVAYDYRIGKYEVTAGQYRDFLNAADPTGANPNGVYNSSMDQDSFGCQITPHIGGLYDFSGRPGATTEADWVNRPVNYVSWYDAARFTNWMTTGNTESGVYTFTGGALTGTMDHQAAAVIFGTAYFIPTENEWYKAAYYDPTLNSGIGGYWDYPTRSDVPNTPSNQLTDPDPGNHATFYSTGYTIGSLYYRTEVGAHENSASPSWTFDQSGNVWEWNETLIDISNRGLRGGSFNDTRSGMNAASRNSYGPALDLNSIGFRVASISVVPEPGSLGLLLLGLAGIGMRRRRACR